MDHLRGRYNEKELEELRKILNSKYGEEYISRAFDEFEIKESDQLSSKDKMKLLENIHGGISIEELIQSIEEEHREQRKYVDRSRIAIRVRRTRKYFSRVFIYGALILLVSIFTWSINHFIVSYSKENHIAGHDSYIQKNTAKGQKLTIRLVDGSKVVLNSNSFIKYPAVFSDTLREVFVVGEAYFDVARDEQKPFVVHSGNLTSKVLGTSFNINYFPEDQINKVALVTGKVKVSRSDSNSPGDESIILLPGELAELHAGKIHKSTFDVWEEISWKNNIIVFKEADYREVFRTLENWYGVDIKYTETNRNISWKLSAKFEDVSLERVLDVLSESQGISYQINGNGVTIKW